MPKLDDLPVELLAHVALFTNKVDNRYDIDVRELLALRCASRCCRDAVRRAARQHEAVYCLGFRGSSAQKIEAIGRVFGVGCRDLHFQGVRSDECVSALRDFVMSTNGQLRKLACSAGEHSIMVPKPVLLEMCRACPLLEYLYLDNVSDSIPANVDDFASALGSACPLLNSVSFPIPGGRSPAEDYQWYFPRSVCLRFGRAANTHLPIRWDGIQRTLQACTHATEVRLAGRTVPQQWVDLLLAAPLASSSCARVSSRSSSSIAERHESSTPCSANFGARSASPHASRAARRRRASPLACAMSASLARSPVLTV